MEVLFREKSDFQIEVLSHDRFGRLLSLDGYIQACQADEFIYHEMPHVPLLGQQRSDTSVLIVGGGDGGILREVLKHDFVERYYGRKDKKVIEVSNRFLDLRKL